MKKTNVCNLPAIQCMHWYVLCYQSGDNTPHFYIGTDGGLHSWTIDIDHALKYSSADCATEELNVIRENNKSFRFGMTYMRCDVAIRRMTPEKLVDCVVEMQKI